MTDRRVAASIFSFDSSVIRRRHFMVVSRVRDVDQLAFVGLGVLMHLARASNCRGVIVYGRA